MPFLSKLRQGKANGWQTIQLGEITDDSSIDCTVNCLRSIPVHECREWTALLLKEINIDRCPKLRRRSLFTLDRVTILYLFQNDFIFFRSSTIRYYIWDCFQYVNVSFLDWKRRIKKKKCLRTREKLLTKILHVTRKQNCIVFEGLYCCRITFKSIVRCRSTTCNDK